MKNQQQSISYLYKQNEAMQWGGGMEYDPVK
jgi:hypothetical protein